MPDTLARLQELTAQLANVSESLPFIQNPERRAELLKHFRALLTELDTLTLRDLRSPNNDAPARG